MRDRAPDLLWYGRMAIWLGSAVLLIQAVLGRGAGPTTVIAALVVTVGLVAFIAGLALPVQRTSDTDAPGPEPVRTDRDPVDMS